MNPNNVGQAVQDLINGVPATEVGAILGASGGLLLLAIILVAARRRWIGLALGIVGLAGVVVGLVIVDQQTVTIRESESITVTRPLYRERTRSLARGAMIALPGLVVLVALGTWASARRRIRRSVPGLIRAGRLHLFAGEYEPAIASFARAIRIMPYLADAYCGRGAAYQGLGDVDRALADFDRAIQFDPRLAHALLQRARIRTGTGDLDGALADLERVMELQPNDPELYLNRGSCLVKKGQLAEAIADFHRVLKLTNHTDYAEPAKDYLRQLEGHEPGLPLSAPLQAPGANGVPGAEALPEPKASDHTS